MFSSDIEQKIIDLQLGAKKEDLLRDLFLEIALMTLPVSEEQMQRALLVLYGKDVKTIEHLVDHFFFDNPEALIRQAQERLQKEVAEGTVMLQRLAVSA
ncbi:MAG: hypothetical protein KTR13_04990 [Saprospiraceae bacterium]|nr:hypothetical protein [Saprospiraceae bacterium]